MAKKIFILDAYALIFRAYYAFINRPIVNSKGLTTSAIFGFTNTLLEVLLKEKPNNIAVAIDYPAANFRHKMFEAYKANRSATPEDIKLSVPYIKEILKALNIPIYEVEGYEADDTIGTLSKKAEKAGYQVFMMTPDKDFAQLVSENIFMYKPKRTGDESEILGVKEVLDKFGIENPLQVIDILGLWGDTADNIPGAPGIGEKTSQKLIEDYGSIENLLNNTDKLKGKIKESLENNREQILMSKTLATIKLDVPVDFSEQETTLQKPDVDKINEIFQNLEFKMLMNKFEKYINLNFTKPLENGQKNEIILTSPPSIQKKLEYQQGDLFASMGVDISSTKKTINDFPINYNIVTSEKEISELINLLSNSPEFCFDTETTNIKPTEAELVGISFSITENQAYYVPISANYEKAVLEISKFKAILQDKTKLKIGQNLKYDIIVLNNYSISVEPPFFDTMIAHYLIEPDHRHNMDYLAETFLDYKTIKIEELIGKNGKNQLNMRDVLPENIKNYACEDADITLKLKNILLPKLIENNLLEIFNNIEMPLIKVLANIEINGVNIDSQEIILYSKKLQKELVIVEEKIHQTAGEKFNIASPKQLGIILFEKLKVISNPKLTKTKQYSTGEEILDKLKGTHEIIDLILDYRSLAKLISTYVEPLPSLVYSKTNRLHTSYNQAVASTGRLSSTSPNLQNIPIKEERGREIRKSFIARNENYTFLSADYSQVELRIMAHLSEDENMIKAFNDNEDIHTATAAKIFNKQILEVSKNERSQAKSANFGIIYGISAFGLAENIGISRKDAKTLIDNYFLTYPKVKEYMDKSIQNARETGYAITIFGRKRNLSDINSQNQLIRSMAERNAINAPIQGASADIIKIAMINIYNKFEEKNLKSKMILQVHDELNFDVFNDELEIVKEIVKFEMENAVKLKVNLLVDIGIGKNWLEAH